VSFGFTPFITEPTAMPTKLPKPAAPMTAASRNWGEWPEIGCTRSRNAMNRVRKPESQRGPQLARRAKAIDAGMRTLPWSGAGSVACLVACFAPCWAARSVACWAVSGLSPDRKPRSSSPWVESTRPGSRIARTVAMTKTTKA
jgi:hypothetical protein